MASELRVNTLKDAAGANSVAMTYVAGGSAKAWVNFNGTGTIAARDSLNVSSLTDNSTGNYNVTLSSAMENANYSISIGGKNSSTMRVFYTGGNNLYTDPTSSNFALGALSESALAYFDSDYMFASIQGDLA